MRLYIVVPKKYNTQINTGLWPKNQLPLTQMFDDLKNLNNLCAFAKWDDAVRYRSALQNNGHLKKIAFSSKQNTNDFPIFTVEVKDEQLKNQKKETFQKGFLSEDLHYYEIDPNDITDFIAVDVGVYKNHAIRQLYHLPAEILLNLAHSNLALSDVGNLMIAHRGFNNLFSNPKNQLTNKFWLEKQMRYHPFEPTTQLEPLPTFRQTYQRQRNKNHHFQWILNRAKEGDLNAFENFNFNKHAELVYIHEDHLGMTILDWLKFYKHDHILQWLFDSRKLESLFKQYYVFLNEDNLKLFSAICLNRAVTVEDMIEKNNDFLDLNFSSITHIKKTTKDRRIKYPFNNIRLAVELSSSDVLKVYYQKANPTQLKNHLLLLVSNFNSNSYEVCQILLEAYKPDSFPEMLLYHAARNKDHRVLQMVLDELPHQINDKASFPSRRRKLIFSPVSTNLFDRGNELTPLHITAYTGNFRAMELLLKRGANIDEMAGGITALQLAAQCGYPDVIDFLLKYQANPFVKGYNNIQAIHFAAKSGSEECVKLLIDYYKSNNMLEDFANSDDEGDSVLHYAIQHPAILKLLLRNGLNTKLIDILNHHKKRLLSSLFHDHYNAAAAMLIMYSSANKLMFNPDEVVNQKMYMELCTFMQTINLQISKHPNNDTECVISALKWYIDQSIFTGYWFNDKDHATTVVQYLTKNGGAMSDEELLKYCEENIKPSDLNNELSIIKIMLTEKLYIKINRKQEKFNDKSEVETKTIEDTQIKEDETKTNKFF